MNKGRTLKEEDNSLEKAIFLIAVRKAFPEMSFEVSLGDVVFVAAEHRLSSDKYILRDDRLEYPFVGTVGIRADVATALVLVGQLRTSGGVVLERYGPNRLQRVSLVPG